jgi:integrase
VLDIEEAARFLWYCQQVDDPLTELFEVLVCTGMRKGEALGLHWADVDLQARLLFVRHILVAVDNSRPVFTTPKTTGSRDWIALSARAVDALGRRARRHRAEALSSVAYHDQGLVFCRPDGQPVRPEYVLRHFYDLADAAGLPRIRVHDLRHLAATIMIASVVPLAMVSKTLRHSTLATTVDIYGHLTRQAAQDAVDAIATALDTAERKAAKITASGGCAHATTLRPQPA